MLRRQNDVPDEDNLLCPVQGQRVGGERDRLHPLPSRQRLAQPQLERGEGRQVHQPRRADQFHPESQRRGIRSHPLVRPDRELAAAKLVGQPRPTGRIQEPQRHLPICVTSWLRGI